jgi:hypothetical protein
MARRIFFGSLVLCVLCAALSQTPDPAVFGIHDEPGRILFYGGFGLLAALLGLAAVASGIYWAVTRFAVLSEKQRRYLLMTILILLGSVLVTFIIRLNPT